MLKSPECPTSYALHQPWLNFEISDLESGNRIYLGIWIIDEKIYVGPGSRKSDSSILCSTTCPRKNSTGLRCANKLNGTEVFSELTRVYFQL